MIQRYNEAAFKNWDQNILEPCTHCGRTFTATAFEHHAKACSADKPLFKKRGVKGDEDQEEEKKPMLGLAARTAANEKLGKWEPLNKKG